MSDGSPSLTIEDFCNKEVDAFGKDADHLQISALSQALRTNFSIIYLSGSSVSCAENDAPSSWPSEDEPNTSEIPCDIVKFETESTIADLGYLLYCPGHYDVLVQY